MTIREARSTDVGRMNEIAEQSAFTNGFLSRYQMNIPFYQLGSFVSEENGQVNAFIVIRNDKFMPKPKGRFVSIFEYLAVDPLAQGGTLVKSLINYGVEQADHAEIFCNVGNENTILLGIIKRLGWKPIRHKLFTHKFVRDE